jgi:hypothetical protein
MVKQCLAIALFFRLPEASAEGSPPRGCRPERSKGCLATLGRTGWGLSPRALFLLPRAPFFVTPSPFLSPRAQARGLPFMSFRAPFLSFRSPSCHSEPLFCHSEPLFCHSEAQAEEPPSHDQRGRCLAIARQDKKWALGRTK